MNIFYTKISAFVLCAHSYYDFQWSKGFNFDRDATGKQAYMSIKADRSLAFMHYAARTWLTSFSPITRAYLFPAVSQAPILHVCTSRWAVIMWLRGYMDRYNLIDYSTVSYERSSRHPKKNQLFVNLFNEPRFCRSRLLDLSSEDSTINVRYLEGERV